MKTSGNLGGNGTQAERKFTIDHVGASGDAEDTNPIGPFAVRLRARQPGLCARDDGTGARVGLYGGPNSKVITRTLPIGVR